MTRFAATLAFVVALLASLSSPAFAARPSGATDPSIVLDQADPHYGDGVTFTVSYPAMRESPRVRVLCQQSGVQVYQYASDPGALFHLWSTTWQSAAAADCSADLYYFTYKGRTQTGVVYLAHTEFGVAP